MITVVDDDKSVCKALERLLKAANLQVRTFSSGEALLESDSLHDSECLIADVCMPGMSGLELQSKLVQAGMHLPIIFITAIEDDRSRKQALDAGAIAYFQKPVDDRALLDSIYSAISH